MYIYALYFEYCTFRFAFVLDLIMLRLFLQIFTLEKVIFKQPQLLYSRVSYLKTEIT